HFSCGSQRGGTANATPGACLLGKRRGRLRSRMTASESGTIAVLAEKPSVARYIAQVLGADKRGTGYLQGNGYVVTWAIGHLVSLAEPHQINPQWRQWRRGGAPHFPRPMPPGGFRSS